MEKKTRSEIHYLDDDHNIVEPDKATQVVISEYDENGMLIRETWGFTERQRKNTCEQPKRKGSGFLKHLSNITRYFGKK